MESKCYIEQIYNPKSLGLTNGTIQLKHPLHRESWVCLRIESFLFHPYDKGLIFTPKELIPFPFALTCRGISHLTPITKKKEKEKLIVQELKVVDHKHTQKFTKVQINKRSNRQDKVVTVNPRRNRFTNYNNSKQIKNIMT